MRTRRVISFLLGAWLAGSLLVAFVAAQNFRMVERVLESTSNPGVRQLLTLGPGDARSDLRLLASEANRFYYETWEWMQLILLVAIAAMFLMSQHGSKTLIVASLAILMIALIQRFVLTPEITRIGRAIDFLAMNVFSDDRNRLWDFQSAYSISQALMWLIGGGMAIRMLATQTLRRLVVRDVDSIDYANDSHVDR